MRYKTKKAQATDIPEDVKLAVFRRDEYSCIFCRGLNGQGLPNAHYIPRSRGGLGIEQNILTACPICHENHDRHDDDGFMHGYAKRYLEMHYPGFPDKDRIYDKWRWLNE